MAGRRWRQLISRLPPMWNRLEALALPTSEETVNHQSEPKFTDCMKQKTHHRFANRHALNALFLLPATTAPVFSQQTPFMEAGTAQPPPPLSKVTAPVSAGTGTNGVVAPEPNLLDKFFNHQVPDVIAQGKFNLNVRLRYEQVDEDGVAGIPKNSYAPTIRTRFGYTTAPLYGFQGMLEGVNVSVVGPEQNYNAAGSDGQGARPAVGDPPLARLDQAWWAYRYTNWIWARAGQQRIVLDNRRFIGESAWRQNIQTFNAVS